MKEIRRGAGFESAATENARAGFDDQVGDGEQLLAGFDRAGPGHDDDLPATDFNPVGKFDYGALGTEAAAGQLVGRSDAVNFRHARHHFDFAGVEFMGSSDSAEHGLARAGGAVYFKAEVD